MKTTKTMTRVLSVGLTAALGASVLSACAQQAGSEEDTTERTLRIATLSGYGSDDEWFRQQYTELFEFANPNITIEIVPAVDYSKINWNAGEQAPNPQEELKKMMQGPNPPDLVALDLSYLPDLINENLLKPLDPLITADKFDTSKIVPTVIEGIKEAAPDGKLYALAPLFSSTALFYNKKLFMEAGVPFPTDGMTWDQIFDLARQVARGEGNERKFGFAFTNYQYSDPFWEMSAYTQPLQLSYYDPSGDKMAVDTDSWEKVWRTIADLQQEGIIPGQPNYEEMPMREYNGPYDWDNFLSGRLAMVIGYYYFVNELINANRTAETDENYDGVDWDVVTMPVHPEYPGIGGSISLQAMMGINANAQNPDDAWKFLKFLNGDDWARLKSRSQSTLVSNMDYVKPKEGMDFNISAFYQLKPAPVVTNDNDMWNRYPNLYMVQSIGQQKFQEVLRGEKEVRQALKEWQAEGDAMLEQMREDPNFMGGDDGIVRPMPIEIIGEVSGDGTEADESEAAE